MNDTRYQHVKRLLAVSPLALAFVASSVGCILMVSPDEGGARCRFRGEDTECGRCLVARCQESIDVACTDEPVLSAMEQCAAAGDEACERVPASDVATCMQVRCGTVCAARAGTSQTSCVDSFLGPGLACSCAFGVARPNERSCNPATYPRARCCAPRAWPSPAVECACNAVSCVASSLGCVCTLTDNLDPSSAEECKAAPGDHCCALGDRCECISQVCTGAQREVEFCNRSELACPLGTLEVPSCSIRQ
jgi:hypothetical protein